MIFIYVVALMHIAHHLFVFLKNTKSSILISEIHS